MKIAFFHFHTFKLPRGIETLVLSLANELSQKGHQITIVSGSKTIKPLIKPNSGVEIVTSPKSRYYETTLAVPFFCAHFLFHDFDRIIVFFADFGEKQTLNFVGRFKKLNTVLYLCYPFSSVPHRYNSMIAAGWKTSLKTILADAEWIAQDARTLFERVVTVVPVGTDPSRFKHDKEASILMRNKFGISNNEIVLLNVGALVERKGVQHVITALSFLKNYPLKFVILGSGSFESILRQKVIDLKLSSSVIFAGTTDELESFYQMADIFIMVPDEEANSVASIEAMSSNLPLIVSADGGYKESIPETGAIFVNQNNIEAIVAAIKLLADNEPTRIEMGEINRRHVIEHLSWAAISELFVKAIS